MTFWQHSLSSVVAMHASYWSLLALALTSWPLMARYVRGQTLQLKRATIY